MSAVTADFHYRVGNFKIDFKSNDGANNIDVSELTVH